MTSIVDSILQSCNYSEVSSLTYYEEERYKRMIKLHFPHAVIDKVEKLNNKHLYAAFELKKCEKPNYSVIELIHSTAAENVKSIEKNNLDWRRVQRAKYGKGVSFTNDADYANYHSSWSGGSRRAYIVCDVLVDSKQITSCCYEVPTGNYDTVLSANSKVYVKFDDFTFYPKCALYYEKPCRTLSRYNCGRRRW